MIPIDGGVLVENLLLDRENPRVVEELHGASQSDLLKYLFDNEVLDELAASFVANGYFGNEPILVLPPDGDGKRIVVEGNRRVSTLMVLTKAHAAVEAGLEFQLSPAPSEELLAELSQVPAYEVRDHEELGAYLGYRHIGGIRPWSAEAKARWIHVNVTKKAQDLDARPFYDVGRMIGSNARGVKSRYLMLEVLRRVRESGDAVTDHVERERFSVWGLLLGNSQFRDYIGLDDPSGDFAAVQDALDEIDLERVGEVVGDLTPRGKGTAVLADSRRVGDYIEVLANDRARQVLRRHGDLELAVATLEHGAVSDRLAKLRIELEELFSDVGRLEVDGSALDEAEALVSIARRLRGAIEGYLTDDE